MAVFLSNYSTNLDLVFESESSEIQATNDYNRRRRHGKKLLLWSLHTSFFDVTL